MSMKKLPKTIKGKEYVALLCDGTIGDWLICGVYSDMKEALKVKQQIRGCFGKHIVKKVSVVLTLK